MIRLSSKGTIHGVGAPLIAKVFRATSDDEGWSPCVRIAASAEDISVSTDAAGWLCEGSVAHDCRFPLGKKFIVAEMPCGHLSDGDVIAIDTNGRVRTLFRRGSRSNTLFATERCNSFCLMCSQPPRRVVDDWRVQEMLCTVDLADRDVQEIGISGGEPTLLGDGFLRVLERCRDRLPKTAIHVLTNGRLFRYAGLAEAVAGIYHHDIMLGVPVYSDLDHQHDYVVQSRGAFEDTYLGLHNLAKAGVPTEIRIVVHKSTHARLRHLADFIYRNFPFAAHVAFMGLEKTGFAVANWADLWIDPMDYVHDLCRAVSSLDSRGMNVSLYNYQLCTVPPDYRRFCRQSISDWKTDYVQECRNCDAKSQCCGFFAFNIPDGISRLITPLTVASESNCDELPNSDGYLA
jgi:His-Xaa-Ser system radical SAM maturase HxsC